MNHGTILKSLLSVSALSRVLGNLVSIPGLLWKTKFSIFPSDLICCDRSVGCQLQPVHLLEIFSLWLYLIFLDFLLYNCSFSVFICISFSSSINIIHAAAAKLQSCPTLCDPIDSSPPGSSVHGILQARTLEWVAISSSSAWKWKVKVKSLSRVWLLWTAACQAPPSMGFSRQEYWSGVP